MRYTSWKKDMPKRTRRALVLKSTTSKNIRSKFIEAGKKMQAISSLSEDRKTKSEAKQDAKYFFDRAKKFSK